MTSLPAKLALVTLGGGLGSVARFWLDALVQRLWPGIAGRFPIGILAVNGLGCLAFGLICGWSGDVRAVSEGRRLFLLTGLLGGFTTFSTFGHDTMRLLTAGSTGLAALNAAGSVVVGVGAVFAGFAIGRWLGAG